MKKILVLSDTHGNRRAIDQIDGVLSESDYIVHLGDTSVDGGYIRTKYPQKTYCVNGNCDPVHLGENEIVLEADGIRILATHGHLYGVKSTLIKLAMHAKELNCQIALYGHTHTADERQVDGVTLINPGSMTRYGGQSYYYLVVTDGKAVGKHVIIKNN